MLMIAGILIGVTVPRLSTLRARRAVANARDAFVFFSVRARAVALERSELVCLGIDNAADRAEIRLQRNDSLVEALDFMPEFGAKVEASQGDVELCYAPTGFALDAYTAGSLPDTVTFSEGSEAAKAYVRALGQVEAL